MAQFNITLSTELIHELFLPNGRDVAFSKLLEEILNQVLIAQSTEQIGAAPYERTDDRKCYRNGFRERELTTRVGTLTLRVPRHRNGNFSSDMFLRYQRSEQALILTMLEMVINGVSTRKIKQITEELCGKGFSKSTVSALCKKLDPVVMEFKNRTLEKHYPFVIVDALYLKVRINGCVRSMALQIAIAINEEGYREVIGFQVTESESESSWGEFFASLKERGLSKVYMITSDQHKGLVKAIRKHFVGTTWQRCQTHFSRNVLDKTPKHLQPKLKQHLRQLYEAINIESARKVRDEIFSNYEALAPRAMRILDAGFDDITAVLNLPLRYRKRLRTSNSIELLNEEIRRRERVIRIFPNCDSVVRLMGSLLKEHDEKWSTGRKYFDMEDFYNNNQSDQYSAQEVAAS